MTTITIDESALEGMESLLGDQFADTLTFCCSEFQRLGSEVLANLGSDNEAATRHAHSLKSNAAQFGAASLSKLAQSIEQALNQNDLATAEQNSQSLDVQVSGSVEKLQAWFANR
jgi:HPt (histidine-containing phosphotransfer) domain-containing protein